MNEKGPASGTEDHEVGHVVSHVVEFLAPKELLDCTELEGALDVDSPVAPENSVEDAEVVGDEPRDPLISRCDHDQPSTALTLFPEKGQYGRPIRKAAWVGQNRVGDALLEPRAAPQRIERERWKAPGSGETQLEQRDLERIGCDDRPVQIDAQRRLRRYVIHLTVLETLIHDDRDDFAGQRAICVGAVGAKILNRTGTSTKRRTMVTTEQTMTAVIRTGS